MFLIPLILIILVIWLVFSYAKPTSTNTPHNIFNNTSTQNKPLEILKERYAKGDISEEEFQKVKRNLE